MLLISDKTLIKPLKQPRLTSKINKMVEEQSTKRQRNQQSNSNKRIPYGQLTTPVLTKMLCQISCKIVTTQHHRRTTITTTPAITQILIIICIESHRITQLPNNSNNLLKISNSQTVDNNTTKFKARYFIKQSPCKLEWDIIS